MNSLALNAGSSSLKAALYEVEPGAALAAPLDPVWRGQWTGIPVTAKRRPRHCCPICPPAAAHAYGGPREWLAGGLRRFGVHGIQPRVRGAPGGATARMPADHRRLITCHLGSGCSLAAVDGGRSVD